MTGIPLLIAFVVAIIIMIVAISKSPALARWKSKTAAANALQPFLMP